jgi:tetratricopeptide (TPR) repeat protein
MARAATMALLTALGIAAWAQHAYDINTPDGKMVGLILNESDAAKKQALLEQFVKTYPDSSNAAWAWIQLQQSYLESKEYDKAMEAGENALAKEPDNVEAAYNNLKAAEGKGDVDAVVKWSAATSQAARKVEQSALSGAEDKAMVDYAKQVDTYTEYSIYATSLKATQPAQIIALVSSLEARNPQSPYLSKAFGRYLNALQQSGQNDKAGTEAEQEVMRDPSNEDALAVAADYNMHHQDTQKTILYAAKLCEVMQTKPKPDEIDDASWQKKRQALLGLGYWMEGTAYNQQRQYAKSDQALRQALPEVKQNSQLLPLVLFQLGVADFELGKRPRNLALLRDALKFSRESAALKSPVQADAARNARAIAAALH